MLLWCCGGDWCGFVYVLLLDGVFPCFFHFNFVFTLIGGVWVLLWCCGVDWCGFIYVLLLDGVFSFFFVSLVCFYLIFTLMWCSVGVAVVLICVV